MNLTTLNSVVAWVAALTATALAEAADGPPAATIEFNRDIRPILADNCLSCHGPDQGQRKAALRLDREESALARLESGGFAIVRGDVETACSSSGSKQSTSTCACLRPKHARC
jgi:hypothetical protein